MMKLSEAIRLGAMLRPQAFGVGADGNGDCALMSAIRAAGCPGRICSAGDVSARDEEPGVVEVSFDFPSEWSMGYPSPCPECARSLVRFKLIAHLNDEHHWTREQIADLVKILEDRHAEPMPQSHALAPA